MATHSSRRFALLWIICALLSASLLLSGQAHAQSAVTPAETLGDLVNLSVPMLRQVWDTADNFNGNCACGPTSAVMTLAYFQKIQPIPMTVNAGGSHSTAYGYHVSNEYRATNGATFASTRATCSSWNGRDWNVTGTARAGAWGSTTDGGNAVASRMESYLRAHGLDVEYSNRANTTVDQDKTKLRQELANGYPVIASVRMRGLGHVVVVRGYTDDGRFILNDPYGNPGDSNYTSGGSRGGENVRLSFPSSEWTYISWMIIVKGQRGVPQVQRDTDDNRRFSSVGQSMTGVLNPNNDDDTYWFNGTSGASIKLNLNANSSGLDPYLYLYRPDGSLLIYNDDANGTLNSEIRITLPTSGDYKISARSYNGASGGNYTLSLNSLTTGDGDDGRWLPWSGELGGTISPNSDRDTYYFNGSAGTVIHVRMNRTGSGLDCFLELYNQNGQLIAQNDDGGGYPNSWIAYRLPANGRYAVVARSYRLASSGSYNINLRSDRLNSLIGLSPDASSSLDPSVDPANATDGDVNTSWTSGDEDSQRLIVDLGQQRTINQAIIRWSSTNFATGYGLFYGDGTADWQPLFGTDSGNGDVDVLTFPPVSTRYLLLEMWARPLYSDYYGINEFEASNTEDILIPLVPPPDSEKPEETDVPVLIPLAPEPEGKEPPLFALGADQESFPLADADSASHAPDATPATLYAFPVTSLSVSQTILLPGESLIATAVDAHDPDNGQSGSGIIAYRWSLLPTQTGPNGGYTIPVGEQTLVTITNAGKIEPGIYSLQLEVQDDEGSWSAPVTQQLILGWSLYMPLIVD